MRRVQLLSIIRLSIADWAPTNDELIAFMLGYMSACVRRGGRGEERRGERERERERERVKIDQSYITLMTYVPEGLIYSDH